MLHNTFFPKEFPENCGKAKRCLALRFRSHHFGGESPVQFALPPSSPLAALSLNTAASSVSSGHTLSVRGRQLVATATSIAVKDLGLVLTLTNRLRLKFNPRRLSRERSLQQAYLPLTLTPLPKGGECDRRLHSSPVLTSQAYPYAFTRRSASRLARDTTSKRLRSQKGA